MHSLNTPATGSCARRHAKGGGSAASRCQCDGIPNGHAHLEGHGLADQKPALVSEAGNGILVQRIPKRTARRQIRPPDTTDDSAKIDRSAGRHHLPLDLGRDRDHARDFGKRHGQRIEVGDPLTS